MTPIKVATTPNNVTAHAVTTDGDAITMAPTKVATAPVNVTTPAHVTVRSTPGNVIVIHTYIITVPLRGNVAHARDFLSSHERVSSRLTSLHYWLIEVETQAATQGCAIVYNCDYKYYPPR